MTTKLVKCTCVHAEQDYLHGVGMRVGNALSAKAGGTEYRCTVCSKVHSHSTPKGDSPTKKKVKRGETVK